jgi:hypothetical protein
MRHWYTWLVFRGEVGGPPMNRRIYTSPIPNGALDRHPGAKHARDELSTRFATECTKLARLQNKRVATDGTTDTANDCARNSFSVALLHHKRASQRIGDGSITCLLNAVGSVVVE